jgi:hypothetical protein
MAVLSVIQNAMMVVCCCFSSAADAQEETQLLLRVRSCCSTEPADSDFS